MEALTGGILALLIRGMPLSISAGVGFIALVGRGGTQRRGHCELHPSTGSTKKGGLSKKR